MKNLFPFEPLRMSYRAIIEITLINCFLLACYVAVICLVAKKVLS